MKKQTIFALAGITLGVGAAVLIAADHVDSPSVAMTTSDIADFYAFEGANPANTVFAVTMQGPLTSGSSTQDAQFAENVMVQINIDNTGDFVADLVIQAARRGNQMYFFGPTAPSSTGLTNSISSSAERNSVEISTTGNSVLGDGNGMRFFAGPRRDPFFFDFNRFNEVASGAVAPVGFLPSGQASDFFDDKNVLALVVEVPNSMLGTAPAHVGGAVGVTGLPNAYNCWVTTMQKQ